MEMLETRPTVCFRGTIQLAFSWIPRTSWKFRGEFSWIPRPSWIPWKFRGIHENFVDSMKTSWSPWKVRGFHENVVGSMEISWSPWKLRGFHENFVESMESSWIPWKLRGFHENFVETWIIHGFHEIPWVPWKSMDSTNSLKLMGPQKIFIYCCLLFNQVDFVEEWRWMMRIKGE